MEKKVVCRNRKAGFEYNIEEVYQAGIVLLGPEVKSLREGRANLTDSYAKVKRGEIFLHNFHINPYPYAHHMNLEPERTRKLLMKKDEIKRLTGKTEERGYGLIPLQVYFAKGLAKVDLALVKGKKKVDKRHAIKERDMKRDLERERKRGS
jgi:SsrA-binding protein